MLNGCGAAAIPVLPSILSVAAPPRRYIADQDVSASWNVKMKERNSTSGMQQDSAAARRAQAELGSEQAERLGTL